MRIAAARVLLTGAGGGIGQAMAERLRASGAAVLSVGRRAPNPADEAWVQADLLRADGRAAVLAAAQRWRPNVVVQAAGLPGFGRIGQLDPLAMQQMLELNLLVPMLLSQALLPLLRAQGAAQLVFVGSALGRIGLPGFSAYGASKAGLHAFAEAAGRPLRDFFRQWVNQSGRGDKDIFTVADALVRLIESEAAERTIGFPERLGVRLNPLLGPLLDGSFAKQRQALDALPLNPPPTPRGSA